jgi:pyridoxal phosphate enzyme (YggS family)
MNTNHLPSMLSTVRSDLAPSQTTLVAVSKTKTVAQIMPLYEQGQRVFGENRVQELVAKFEAMPKDIEWHLIGHLQSNKVKYIAPFVRLIHSVDSLELLVEINKQAQKNNRVIDCLLQFHVAQEETKFGLNQAEAELLFQSAPYPTLSNIRVVGVMGMATFTDNKTQVRAEFQHLKRLFNSLKNTYFSDNQYFKEISMGMSDDYLLAIAEGSTMVRIGSLLFKN